ncbi:MAG: SDR family NAD(P)-dependent oxidoreductase [Gammaproteobacteria bacterium]|nr:SDR family NAD(P)-dependent oxidoreductase [Gammaproteobacteria bacterium]
MATQSAFITGTSSGLGLGLARHLVAQGWAAYGCSRRGCNLPGVHDVIVDLGDPPAVAPALQQLLGGAAGLDLVVLNAGVLGEIRDMTATPLADLQRVMAVNVWANKLILDWLHAWGRPIGQIVLVSSGAAVLGNRGWGGYALSKAALNMLARLYAHEFAASHIAAVAPGIIDTAMMDHLCDEADAETFPALQRLRAARGTVAMPGPLAAAERLVAVLPQLRERPSGSFVDIREILDPDAHARLYGDSARH